MPKNNKAKLIDYHIHTQLSGDNNQTIYELANSIIEKQINEVCITEHIDFNPTDTCYNCFNWTIHQQNINILKNDYNINAKCGAEIDYQKQYLGDIKTIINSCDFDYVMGSSHYVNNQVVFNHDEYFLNKTEEIAYTDYFTTELEMIKTGLFDSVAHFDLIKRWGCRFYGQFNPLKYTDSITDCLKEIISQDMTIELNSAGTRQDTKDFYPHIDILKLYRELGGDSLTFGSDCHNPSHLALNINEGYAYIKSLGFTKLAIYKNRKKDFIPI